MSWQESITHVTFAPSRHLISALLTEIKPAEWVREMFGDPRIAIRRKPKGVLRKSKSQSFQSIFCSCWYFCKSLVVLPRPCSKTASYNTFCLNCICECPYLCLLSNLYWYAPHNCQVWWITYVMVAHLCMQKYTLMFIHLTVCFSGSFTILAWGMYYIMWQ